MTLCVMCFDVLKEHVQIINHSIQDMLQTLLINIDKSSSEQSGICSTCQGKLENCYYFKKKCMFTEDMLGPFITENVKINLNEIPIQIIKSEDGEKDKNICRLCLQYSDDDIILSKDVKEHFHALFPEINLNLTNFVVLCSTCYEMLQKYFLFVPLSSRLQDPLYKFSEDSSSRQSNGESVEDCQEFRRRSEEVGEKKFVLINDDIQIKNYEESTEEEERLHSSSMDCSIEQINGIKSEEIWSTSVNSDAEDDKKLMLLHEELDIKSERDSSEKEIVAVHAEDVGYVSIVPGTSTTHTSKSEYDSSAQNSSAQENTLLRSIIFNEVPANVSGIEQSYIKKLSARERPAICPFCFKDIITHFTRHLFRYHKNKREVLLLESLKPRGKKRLALVASLRKQGYFILHNEKGILNPVRTSMQSNAKYFVCPYCLGYYSKKLLYKHVKICNKRPLDVTKPGKNCLSKSQTFLASIMSKDYDFLKQSRLKQEVFDIMRPDEISFVAKNDPIICLYGEALLNKHKKLQVIYAISNKIREMGRLLIALKTIDSNITGMFGALKLGCFSSLVSAAKIISGFDTKTKSFKAPSLCLHMGTNLKMMCDVALKIVIDKRIIPNIVWKDDEEKKTEINELKKMIEAHWCDELPSLALKNLNKNHWEKLTELPSTADILVLQSYVSNLAEEAYNNLKNEQSHIRKNYKILTECVLVLTIMFNRGSIEDVQYLKIMSYTLSNKSSNEEAFMQCLTPVEKILSMKFKRVVTGGKGSKPVPILFSNKLQKFVTCLIEIRSTTSVVPKSNPFLFASLDSETRWMSGTNVMRKLAQLCGAKNSRLLTSTKFRKHIATTLQLMSMEDNEMEQIATFMGHTKKTHSEFSRLPQNIYQAAKVAKILLLLEKGKGEKFKGKSLSEIELERDIYYNSEADNNDELDNSISASERVLKWKASSLSEMRQSTRIQHEKKLKKYINDYQNIQEIHLDLEEPDVDNEHEVLKKSVSKFKRKKNIEKYDKHEENISMNVKHGPIKSKKHQWTKKEKQLVLNYFQSHITRKVVPKRHECEAFFSHCKDFSAEIGWLRVKTLVYNSYRDK